MNISYGDHLPTIVTRALCAQTSHTHHHHRSENIRFCDRILTPRGGAAHTRRKRARTAATHAPPTDERLIALDISSFHTFCCANIIYRCARYHLSHKTRRVVLNGTPYVMRHIYHGHIRFYATRRRYIFRETIGECLIVAHRNLRCYTTQEYTARTSRELRENVVFHGAKRHATRAVERARMLIGLPSGIATGLSLSATLAKAAL